jgi:hypothetical protein
MTERTIFMAALEIADPAARATYLANACSGDAALRRQVETLLAAHEREGKFLEVPALEQVVKDLPGDGRREPQTTSVNGLVLDFLTPSQKPGSLGRLSHYEILEVIGRGGMGIVLKAFDEQLQRVVAIKVMAASLASNATSRKRFVREARAAAAVSHDHVVTIHAVEEGHALPYLVMQYVAGESLQERLDRDGPLELREVLRIGMQAAAGLAAAHTQGIVHRDVKPANILLENGVERVKITDFGLARAAADASLTQSGVVAGTPHYMSPEQAEGKPVDHRSDLFSLGSVLYAMCSGRAPFRADDSMAILKRVCEETPTPIREINPEVPDGLAAIIDKLLAKNPAERFQSAAEVAELLNRHLAHMQHASVVGHVSNLPEGPQSVWKPAWRRRGWAVAAAVLLLLLGGLSLTEATGVTRLAATVIRILTPDGTLVVEVDDPSVKVTIEGDGGIVITGAGPQEVRLRPGTYKVQADRDGKRVLLEREVVSIAKGGREFVRVKLEAPASQEVGKIEKEAFVLLGGNGALIRKFDALADAVTGASDGDVIEIRGNGPFVSPPIKLNCALTIRASEGFRPVIRLSPEALQRDAALLETNALLILEGLELQHIRQRIEPGDPLHFVVRSWKAPLYLANCRLRIQPGNQWCVTFDHSSCFLAHNCEFLNSGDTFGGSIGCVHFPSKARVLIDNCVQVGRHGFAIAPNLEQHDLFEVSIQMTRNSWLNARSTVYLERPAPTSGEIKRLTKKMRLEASENIYTTQFFLAFREQKGRDPETRPLEAPEVEKLLQAVIDWREQLNLYSIREGFTVWSADLAKETVDLPAHGPKTLTDWATFWGSKDADCREGLVRFQGGDLLKKLATAPDKLTPEDFRLRPDSAGYRAGPGGKDLGAEIDLVGPGPAYERWKKTPEYHQWLKETWQNK